MLCVGLGISCLGCKVACGGVVGGLFIGTKAGTLVHNSDKSLAVYRCSWERGFWLLSLLFPMVLGVETRIKHLQEEHMLYHRIQSPASGQPPKGLAMVSMDQSSNPSA